MSQTTTTWTPEADRRLRDYLTSHGRLTDEIPPCMSEPLGQWIIQMQDAMPDDLRNSYAWRELLPLAAGTGREREREREVAAVAVDHMWRALGVAQPVADAGGFGVEWRAMCEQRVAYAAARAADAACFYAYVAYAAARAADAAYAYAYAYVAYAARAARAAAAAAARAARVAYAAAADADDAGCWAVIDPVSTLRDMIAAANGTNREGAES